MTESPATFDNAMRSWREWQDSPWGRIRYGVSEANLVRHLPILNGPALRMLDLAGGDGGDAVPLAVRGHHVTVIDHAPAMLSAARERATVADVTTRITCVEADVDDMPRRR